MRANWVLLLSFPPSYMFVASKNDPVHSCLKRAGLVQGPFMCLYVHCFECIQRKHQIILITQVDRIRSDRVGCFNLRLFVSQRGARGVL